MRPDLVSVQFDAFVYSPQLMPLSAVCGTYRICIYNEFCCRGQFCFVALIRPECTSVCADQRGSRLRTANIMRCVRSPKARTQRDSPISVASWPPRALRKCSSIQETWKATLLMEQTWKHPISPGVIQERIHLVGHGHIDHFLICPWRLKAPPKKHDKRGVLGDIGLCV